MRNQDDTLRTTEVFTDTIQGEGPTAGRLSSVVRLAGCHRSCKWCDTTYAWKAGEMESEKRTVASIMETIQKGNAGNVIITGGEPLLHQASAAFRHLVKMLLMSQITIEIETEGSIYVEPWLASRALVRSAVRFNVSPKLKNSGMDVAADYTKLHEVTTAGDLVHRNAEGAYTQHLDDVRELVTENEIRKCSSLERLYSLPNTCFKFVVTAGNDIIEIQDLLNKALPDPDILYRNRVFLMSEGTTRAAQLERMEYTIALATAYGYNYSPRLHVLTWDNKRGV